MLLVQLLVFHMLSCLLLNWWGPGVGTGEATEPDSQRFLELTVNDVSIVVSESICLCVVDSSGVLGDSSHVLITGFNLALDGTGGIGEFGGHFIGVPG